MIMGIQLFSTCHMLIKEPFVLTHFIIMEALGSGCCDDLPVVDEKLRLEEVKQFAWPGTKWHSLDLKPESLNPGHVLVNP